MSTGRTVTLQKAIPSSLPGLTRQSINLEEFSRRDGCPGMTREVDRRMNDEFIVTWR
jgi:hypothetical protein